MVGRMRSQSRAELDTVLEEYRLLTGRIRRLRKDLASLTATGRSADGCARVTVNASGELVGLTFDAAVAARFDHPVLAARVEEAAASAAAEVRRSKQALMSELLPSGLRHLMDEEGLGGLGGLLPEDVDAGMLTRDGSTPAGQR
jgi:DNA-binding protein YbaB